MVFIKSKLNFFYFLVYLNCFRNCSMINISFDQFTLKSCLDEKPEEQFYVKYKLYLNNFGMKFSRSGSFVFF